MKILSVFPEPAREELVNWLLMFPQHPRGFGSSATAKVFSGNADVSTKRFSGRFPFKGSCWTLPSLSCLLDGK